MGRVLLVNYIIQGMLLYSFRIYQWPVSLLKLMDRWMKNFVWSGDLNCKKTVTVAWSSVCRPLSEGGLGIRSIRGVNEAGMLKLSWEFASSCNPWNSVLKCGAFKNNVPAAYHLTSSIWPRIRDNLSFVVDNSCWLLGDRQSINFWKDLWLSKPIVELLNVPTGMHTSLQAKVSDFINDGC